MSDNVHFNLSDPLLTLLPILVITFLVVGLCFAFCCYLLRPNHDDYSSGPEFQRRSHYNGLRKTNYKKKWLASFSLKSDTCSICLDDFQNKDEISICRCGHAYHHKCIMKWMEVKETCPICQGNCRHPNRTRNTERTPLLLDV